MDTIRKRLARSNEQCEETSTVSAVAQHDKPARPLDVLFPPDAFESGVDIDDAKAPDLVRAATPGDRDISQPASVPLFRRIRSKPRRLPAPISLSAPDWSLSFGAAVIVLGFAIVFGTWATLTERDAMQSRLRQIVGQTESRALPGHERATIADRTQELSRVLREQIETLRGRDATGAAVIAGTTSSAPAKAHSGTLASNAPALPPGSPPSDTKLAATKTTAKIAIKSAPPAAAQLQPQSRTVASRPLAPPLPPRAPQPAPRARQLANAAPPPIRVASSAQHDQKTKTATNTCTSRAPCSRVTAQSASKPIKTASVIAHKPKTNTVAARNTAKKPTVKPVHYAGPPTMQAYVQPEPVTLPAGDDKEVYRQH